MLAVLVLIPSTTTAQQEPVTVAEASNFTATSRHSDVMDFIRQLQQQSSLLRVETLCTSAEGRQVPLLVIGEPVPSSPADLHYDDRAVVYFQANIHAGEVEGKEAALMLARDIVQGKTANYLDRLVILIAPIFNADGNERISPNNRRNQVGPEQGVGIRYNGQNLDLNRDGLKMESPEVQGLVQNVLSRWDPIFFLDSHTHNGSYHQEPVTWTWGLNPNGDTALLDYMADVMMSAINRHIAEKYNTFCIPHGDFMNVGNPEEGWVPLGPQPRYLSNYVGLRNRLAVLNENYPYADYETRVRGCYNLFLSFLETILGYEMEITEVEGGRRRTRVTDRKKTYSDVPYYARYVPKRTVHSPRGYLIEVQDPAVLEKLLQHGITVERLTKPAEVEVESFIVSQITTSGRLNQGHYTNAVQGEYSMVEKEFPVGTLFVSTAQPLANVAAYLLEPESDDGLLVWNFFDRYLATQWGRGTRIYPVHRLLKPVNLVKETVR